MTYTSNFGVTPYNDINLGIVNVPDLTKFASIPDKFKQDSTYTLQYQIRDGERLDQISKRIYDQEERYWIIMLMNDMVDLSNSWPLNEEEFYIMISMKYPFNQLSDIHHYEDINGCIVDPYAGAIRANQNTEQYIALNNLTTVDIETYEKQINEAKRNIIILDPTLVDQLEASMGAAFENIAKR